MYVQKRKNTKKGAGHACRDNPIHAVKMRIMLYAGETL
jgi:hypothetical protein